MIINPLKVSRHTKVELLSSRLFILGLILLLSNDFIFKPLFHNYLTGKISDFAGLFIFPYFFSVFFIRKAKYIYLLTGICFVLWKSPAADVFINWWNAHIFFPIDRTIDYSDLAGLVVLPFSYYYLKNTPIPNTIFRFSISCIIGVFALFSFCATSQPRQEFDLLVNTDKQYTLPFSKETLFKKLNYGYGYSNSLNKNLTDTLFYCYFDISEHWTSITAIVDIKESSNNQTTMVIDSVIAFDVTGKFFSGIDKKNINFIKSLEPADFEKYFEQNYVNVLIKGDSASRTRLFFDNKQLVDQYIKYQ